MKQNKNLQTSKIHKLTHSFLQKYINDLNEHDINGKNAIPSTYFCKMNYFLVLHKSTLLLLAYRVYSNSSIQYFIQIIPKHLVAAVWKKYIEEECYKCSAFPCYVIFQLDSCSKDVYSFELGQEIFLESHISRFRFWKILSLRTLFLWNSLVTMK